MIDLTPDTNHSPALTLPPQEISAEILLEKYAKDGERAVDDVYRRVANALAAIEPESARGRYVGRSLNALHSGFIPVGRIQSAAGKSLSATLINCFVQPIGDSIASSKDGHPGIYSALAEAAETMRRSGGVSYDFSRIRSRYPAAGINA